MSKNFRIKKVALAFSLCGIMFGTVGCVKPYNEPTFQKIEPSQTAFLVPLVGDTTNQGVFDSEDLLQQAKVPTKEVEIPKRWVQLGRRNWQGEWRPSAELIVVERKPVTREWTNDAKTGTSDSNQGVPAKTKNNIKFISNLNCTAQINEEDSATFLYRYNNSSLEQVMDREIKTMVHSTFIEEASKYDLEELKVDKIISDVRAKVEPYFKERGITITALGFSGDPQYPADIQKSMDEKFKAEQAKQTQKIRNEKEIEQARAEAEAIKIRQETFEKQKDMKVLDIFETLANKWDGSAMPQVIGSDANLILDMKQGGGK